MIFEAVMVKHRNNPEEEVVWRKPAFAAKNQKAAEAIALLCYAKENKATKSKTYDAATMEVLVQKLFV